MDWIHALVAVAVVVGLIALWAGSLVSIARTARGGAAAVWAVVVIVFPVAGSVAWFVFGRPAVRGGASLDR